jgi:PAS domain S-box-containing protein
VSKNQGPDRKAPIKSSNCRPTIGLLSDRLYNEYSYTMWAGVADAARERGVNLLYFTGGHLNTPGYDLFNTIYELANPEILDGLVIWSALLGHQVGPEATRAFCERYRPLPMVSIGLALEGVPSILVDSYQGMRDVVTHLIEKHGYRRIAYLVGPEASQEAQDRYRGYADALAEHGIALDPGLVVSENQARSLGAMHEYEAYSRAMRGEPAMSQIDLYHAYAYVLLARRQAREMDFEAVAGHDDYRTLRVLEILRARGVRVPDDVAIAGFDDVASARYATPPLTTAQQPFYDLGRQATEMLLTLLHGEQVPPQMLLPMKVAVRRSCGCVNPQIGRAKVAPVKLISCRLTTKKTFRAVLGTCRERIISEMVQAVGSPAEAVQEGAGRLVDTFVAEMGHASPGAFLSALDDVLRGMMAADGDFLADSDRGLAAWQDAISALRRQALPCLAGGEDLLPRAENLWQQARVAVGEMAERARAARALQADLQMQALREVSQALTTTFDLDKVVDMLAARLPPFGIPACYLSIYENPEAPTDWARLILAYNGKGRVELESGGQRFPSLRLVPEEISLPQARPYSILVEPLFRERPIGFVLFEVGPRQGAIYEELRGQISSALKGALLLQERREAETALEQAYAEVERQVQERTSQLQQEVAERRQAQEALQKLNAELDRQVATRTQRLETVATLSGRLNAILDVDQLLAELVDQVKEHLDYYHAQIYLLDDGRKHLTLGAGYGEAGAQMKAKGYRVSLDSPTGLIPRAAREGVSLLVEDVRQEPAWQRCPFLPDTRAELAVPIVAEGKVVGVLDVQSDRAGGLDESDVSLLHSLANQVGVALTNARMFASIRRQAEQLEALRRVSQDLIALRDLDTLLHQIVERAIQLLGGEGGGIYLYRLKRDALEWAVVVGENPVPLGTAVSRGEGLSGKVWETGEPAIADDYESWAGRMPQVAGPIGAVLGVPIRRGEDFLGVLLIWTGSSRAALTPEHAALASQFAAQAAIALENARLFEALRVSEERYALAVQGSNDGIYDHDLVSNTLYWSPRLKEMLGYADGELEIDLDTFMSFMHPDDVEQAKVVLQSDWRTDRTPHELEQRVRTKSGEYRWFITRGRGIWNDSGQLVRIAGSVTDITERKRIEEHLQRTKEELQKQNSRLEALYWVGQMINSTLRPDVVLGRLTDEAMRISRATHGQVLVVDEEHGRYERRSLYGFSPEEAERARTIPLPLDRGVNGRAYTTRGPVRVDDVQAEPGYFPLIASTRTELAVPIIRDGQILGNLDLQSPEVGAFRDVDMEYLSALTGHVAIALTNARLYQQAQQEIAERLRVEEELRQAKEAAEVATRAKSEFLANMSHEIRTPMNAIIGMTEILCDTELTGEQRECAEIIRTSGDTLLTIISDILDFSKIESGRLELENRPFNLRDCLEEALDLLTPKATEKGLEMGYAVDDQTPETLLGDATRLRQVLMNLLSNAVKFTESGEVVVAVTCSMTAEKQRRIHFAVKDTGIGIPPQHMGRLFRSFSQLDASTTRKYGGTGLGLTISKHLSELMGGTMWAESDGLPDHGSTFHFTILAEVAADQEYSYLHILHAGLAGKRILIVDDSATNRHILGRQIRAWGMVPCEAASGREALARIRDGEPFDAAILDMHMPEMDGLTLAAEIRACHDARTLPLIMLTSLGEAREISRNGGSEFAACLTKPVKFSQLYSALARILTGQTLPAGEPASPERLHIDPALGERHPLRILLAEDNAANQKVALSQLKKMGYRADVAANGGEVLQALERQPYDLVLLDVQMPEMDGLEATCRIRERWPGERGPRIIAVTASTMQEDRERCLEAGMNDYIGKPVRIEELAAALSRCQPVTRPDHRPDGLSPSPTPNGKTMAIAKPDVAPGRGTAAHAGAAIDTAVLEGLSAGMEEVVPELIDIYFDGTPKLLADMRQAVAQDDASLLARAAHTLKPSSATLGAIPLATLCEELEAMGRAGVLEGAAEKLAQVEAEYRRVKTELEAIR